MKFSVTAYSFLKYIKQTGCDHFKLCDLAKEMGFDGIEFVPLDNWNMTDDCLTRAKELRSYCEKIGLEIVSYTVGANFLAEDIDAEMKKIKARVDEAEALGVKVMRHDVTFALKKQPLYNYRTAIKEIAPLINEISEYAKSKGIRTCSENHGTIFQAPERVEELILTVNNPNYGWLCDMGNFLCADVDPIKAVAIAAPYAFHVHAKDFIFKPGTEPKPSGSWYATSGGNYLRGTVIGHGVVPVRACINALKKAGYDGFISVEFEGMEDCLDGIKAGLETLKASV